MFRRYRDTLSQTQMPGNKPAPPLNLQGSDRRHTFI
jgi:hypothetical protein